MSNKPPEEHTLPPDIDAIIQAWAAVDTPAFRAATHALREIATGPTLEDREELLVETAELLGRARQILLNRTPEYLLEKAIAALPDSMTLHDAAYGDKLTIEQVAKILDGKYDQVVDEIWQNLLDYSEESYAVTEGLKNALPDREEQTILKESDQWHDFVRACEDRDDNTVFTDLVNGVGRTMIRFHLLDPQADDGGCLHVDPYSYAHVGDEFYVKEARRIADAAGLDWETNQESLTDVVCATSYGGDACVLAYVEFAEIAEGINHVLKDPDDPSRYFTVTFEGEKLQLILLDSFHGSGWDTEVKGRITFKVNMDAIRNGMLRCDHKGAGRGHGHSWSDDIAGIYYPAFAQDPKIELFPAPETKEARNE